jgi:hypothetical protein
MFRNIFLTIILISLFMTGCGRLSATPEQFNTPTADRPVSTLPTLDGEWTIKLIHSGGIMGLLRSIEISSNGKYTVTDERANKTVTGEFAEYDLSKIKERVNSAKYLPPSGPDGMVCADCFIYDLEIQENGRIFSIQLNDIDLPNSGLESLVTYLRGLMETALK